MGTEGTQWVQRVHSGYRGTVGTEVERNSGYRGTEEQWLHRNSVQWVQRHSGTEGTEEQ